MAKVGIVTDSNCCLPLELVKEYDIQVVPHGLEIEGKFYRDQIDITPEEFWQIFKEKSDKMSIGALSPGAVAEVYQELGKITDSIVGIFVTEALSATCQAARIAREIVKSENPKLIIEIVNSTVASGAQGFIVLEAARAAKAGKSIAEIMELVNDMKPRVKLLIGLETLKYLIKIGRAPKTAYIGEVLGIKPIVGLVSGKGVVESLGKVRGKKNMMKKLVDMIGDYVDASKPLHLMVHFTDSLQDGKEVRDMATFKYNFAEVYMSSFTPVMGYATGPVVAVSFYADP